MTKYAVFAFEVGAPVGYTAAADDAPLPGGAAFFTDVEPDQTAYVLGDDGLSLRALLPADIAAVALDALKGDKRREIDAWFQIAEKRSVSERGEQWPGGKDSAVWLVSVWAVAESTGDDQSVFPINAPTAVALGKDDIGLIAQRVLEQATQDEATRRQLLGRVDAASDAPSLAAITIPAAWT